MSFIRTKEDFTCEKCGYFVMGTGYTNHCPKCLWGKHVDIDPGDRLAKCLGLMEPVGVETRGREHFILHKCVVCGHERPNKVSEGDDFEEVVKLSNKN